MRHIHENGPRRQSDKKRGEEEDEEDEDKIEEEEEWNPLNTGKFYIDIRSVAAPTKTWENPAKKVFQTHFFVMTEN